jgi:hypothetical protein
VVLSSDYPCRAEIEAAAYLNSLSKPLQKNNNNNSNKKKQKNSN